MRIVIFAVIAFHLCDVNAQVQIEVKTVQCTFHVGVPTDITFPRTGMCRRTSSALSGTSTYKHILIHVQYELFRQKTYLQTRAPGEDSDQPVHSRRLISIVAGRILNSKDAKILHADNKDLLDFSVL